LTPHKRLTGALAGVLIGAGSVAGLPPGPAAAAPAAPAPAQSATPRAAQAITLVTGDVVQLAPAGDGRVAATVRPGPGRERISFTTTETAEGVRVVPSDAVRLLADGRLDAELFDVQHLIDSGFGDAASPTLPLIVKSAQGASTARSLGAPAGRELPSIGAVAVRADKDSLAGFWRTQVGAATGARGVSTDKIWLDGKVKSLLDRSTAQIGAPDAWKAGLDGTGVKVAVLDTGVDPTHPDLAGRIAEKRDFSGAGEDAVDHHGHGTHVASTVAGSGAGSNGTRKGVAPGAQLLIGKVLDDGGSGSESGIIAGMEWAANSGAKVVSMSLGGSSTDGTDPMSAAVDELSAATGALFVVAAGNEGGDYTVGTPGVARAALTVGAVDRDDHLADFSSRGPRWGDEGLKPEITAPGVGIVAARAAGTSMGGVVDELYTSASGTSMATPHVAGAAAIIAQQHPDWTGAQIKNELVSTAKTTADTSVYSQGAGRVDLTRATSQQIFGTGVADFGLRELGETPAQVNRTVTYTNGGATAVTLTLSDDVAQVTTSASTVTVPAGGSADVTLTFDQSKADPGRFSGWLTATGPNGVKVTTAIGGLLDGPRHNVTFKAVNRSGEPAAVPAFQMFGDDQRFDVLDFFIGTSRTYQLGEGDYLVDALIPDGVPLDEQETLVTIPELKVDRDLTVVLDARTGRPIKIETPKPAEQQTILSYYVHRVTGTGRSIINGFMSFSTTQAVNVTPTAKLREGSYEFSSRWQLVAPLTQASIPGVTGDLDVNLCVYSPTYEGARRFDLVKGLNGNVRGKAVVIEGDNPDEASAAAAAAGAAFALLVLPADRSAWQPWSPEGGRMPIPTALVPFDDGQKILARAARKSASITLTLTPNSPYLYDVYQVSKGQVPSQIVHKVTTANTYRITTKYQANGGFEWIKEQRFGWRPEQQYAWNDASRAVRTPSEREEWVSTGETLWQHQVHHAWPWGGIGGSNLQGGIQDDVTTYPKAGSAAETWYEPVVRPATPTGYANTREGNTLKLRVASYVDSTDRHYLLSQAPATLSRDGVEVATLPDGWQDVPVAAGNATYKLAVSTARDEGEEWLYGTSTATEWTFKSGADGKLPLLQVGYDAPVSSTGVATKLPHLLGVKVPGAQKVKVETSADEGRTWKTALTIGSAVLVPAGQGTVSLRVTAGDKSGNSVTQTVLRAYGRS
jgi:subtilisin family serine protease